MILPLWNAYSFLVTYARVDGWRPTPDAAAPTVPDNVLDRWILSRLAQAVADIREGMDAYDLQRAALRFTGLIEELTNWYIRRSRRRFWRSSNDRDKEQAYATLHHVLLTFCKLAAPFVPFVTEAVYRNLRTPQMPESVHFCDVPEAETRYLDAALSTRMARTMTTVSLGRFLRTQSKLRVRQPLAEVVVAAADREVRRDIEAMADVIAEELNVKRVTVGDNEEELVRLEAKANFRSLGPRLGRNMPKVATAIAALASHDIARLRSGEVLEVAYEGGCVELGEEDVLVDRIEKEGLTVANEGEVTVALDTRLTADLIQEGWAREIVSRIQNLRKDTGLEVEDRIHLTYDLPDEPRQALEKFGEYVQTEVLALSLTPGELADVDPVEINGIPCRFRVEKA